MKEYLKKIESKEAKNSLSQLSRSFKENESKNLKSIKRNRNKSFILNIKDIILDASRYQVSKDTIEKA